MIVLAENNLVVLETTAAILRHYDFKVVECANSQDALRQYQLHSDSVRTVISGFEFPQGINGIEFLQSIQDTDPNIAVILLTGAPPKNIPTSIKVFSKPNHFSQLLNYLNTQKLAV